VRRSQHLAPARIYGRRVSFNSYHSSDGVPYPAHVQYSFHGEGGVWATSIIVPYNGRLHHEIRPEDGASSKTL